jgi:hypothetical protein
MKQCTLATKESLEQALNEAEKKAHNNLARYKFMMFGYWAAIWTHLNRIGNFRRPNPFSAYVDLAILKGGKIDTDSSRKTQKATRKER